MAADMVRHEGLRLDVYADSLGLPTQGVGQHDGVNFGDPPIDKETAFRWLATRLQQAYSDALALIPGLADIDTVRKEGLVELAYNLGASRLAQFIPFLKHVNAAEWPDAAFHLLTNTSGHLTPYLLQTGARAAETALRIATGQVLKEFAV
jgi:GH24 family phage-related lysozyme (muramidase)